MHSRGTRVYLAALAVLLLAVAPAVMSAEKRTDTVVYAYTASPPTLDWHWSTANAVRTAAPHIWEGLVAYDSSSKLHPMLAEKWELSKDELTWTFYLRKGIRFHNGKEMTSEDVVASVKRWMQVSPRQADMSLVKDVQAAGKYSVVFKLKDKFGALPAVLGLRSAHVAIMPKEVVQNVEGGKLKQFIGTGPYEFVEWVPDRHILLKKYDGYQPAPGGSALGGYAGTKTAYFDQIKIVFVPEPATRVAGLETGEFDIVESVSPMEYDRLLATKGTRVQILKPKWNISFWFNSKSPLFANKTLRQAVAAALDMEEILLSAGERAEFVRLNPSIFFPEQVWWTDAGASLYNQHNPEKAKRLMKEAGYKGELIRVMTTKDYPWMYKAALPLCEQLKDVGFNIKMEVYDWPTLVSKRAQPSEWEIYSTGRTIVDDPIMLRQNYLGTYPGWYTSPEIQEQLDIVLKAGDFDTRYRAVRAIDATLKEDAPNVNLGEFFELRAFRSDIEGIAPYDEVLLWNVQRIKK